MKLITNLPSDYFKSSSGVSLTDAEMRLAIEQYLSGQYKVIEVQHMSADDTIACFEEPESEVIDTINDKVIEVDFIGRLALDSSILKWKKIVAFYDDTTDDDKSDPPENGIYDCALCQYYQFIQTDIDERNGVSSCDGCPVFQQTGLSYCVNTPYAQWDKKNTVESAKDMVVFLRDIRRRIIMTPKGGD